MVDDFATTQGFRICHPQHAGIAERKSHWCDFSQHLAHQCFCGIQCKQVPEYSESLNYGFQKHPTPTLLFVPRLCSDDKATIGINSTPRNFWVFDDQTKSPIILFCSPENGIYRSCSPFLCRPLCLCLENSSIYRPRGFWG